MVRSYSKGERFSTAALLILWIPTVCHEVSFRALGNEVRLSVKLDHFVVMIHGIREGIVLVAAQWQKVQMWMHIDQAGSSHKNLKFTGVGGRFSVTQKPQIGSAAAE